MFATTGVVLAATGGFALLGERQERLWQSLAFAVSVCAVAPLLLRLHLGGRGASRWGRRDLGQLLVHLVPVLLLSIAYPLATEDMAQAGIGGVSLPALLLASSLTVPWLSQIVCMPMFNGVWEFTASGDQRGLARRLLDTWPLAFVAALPVAGLFAVPIGLTMGWGAAPLACYTVLAVLHLTFAQSLVFSIADRNGLAWAAAWSAYAAALVVAPTLWYLPPLVGTATQLVMMLHKADRGPQPTRAPGIVGNLGRGVLLGSVLWCDKFLYFVRWHDVFDAGLVFASMLPAIVAYNYYFVVEAPRVDVFVNRVRGAMEGESVTRMRHHSRVLQSHIESSALKASYFAAVLGFGGVLVLGIRNPDSAALIAAMVLASWCFVVTSLLCYKLAYIGRTTIVLVHGALHLAVAVLAFGLAPDATTAYTVIGVLELVGLGYLARESMAEWRAPEYALFWRHATRW